MHYDDPNAFIEHSNNIQDAWKTIKKYNPGKKRINKLKKTKLDSNWTTY